jgi:hypothetical protein
VTPTQLRPVRHFLADERVSSEHQLSTSRAIHPHLPHPT